MLNNFLNKIPHFLVLWILFYALLFSLLLHNSFNYLDPDLGWHLKVGQEIIQEKSVPSLEHYDYTLTNQKWVDHEWLLNTAIFFIYNSLGYIALNIFFALLITIALIILHIFILKCFLNNKQGVVHIAIFLLLGTLAMTPHLGVRLQEFTLLYLLLLFIIIHKYNINRYTKILWWLLPLMFIWANTHGSFLIGFGILFFWLFIKGLENIKIKYNFLKNIKTQNLISPQELLIFLIFSLLAIAATLINPYGLSLYSFLSDYANSYYMNHINEWLPAFHYPIIYWQLIYTAIIATIIVLISSSFIKAKKQPIIIDLWPIALSLFFLLLAIKVRRHFPLFFIASFPLLIHSTSQGLLLPPAMLKYIKNYFLYFFLSACLLLSTLYLLVNAKYTNQPFTASHFCENYPCAAVEYLKINPGYADKKIFNRYGWGGYLIWQWPEKKLFIDGRLPQYQYAGHTLLAEYNSFSDKEKLKEKLDQHNIQMVLMSRDKKIMLRWFDKFIFGFSEEDVNTKNPIIEYLETANDWRLAYDDRTSLVYIKND